MIVPNMADQLILVIILVLLSDPVLTFLWAVILGGYRTLFAILLASDLLAVEGVKKSVNKKK